MHEKKFQTAPVQAVTEPSLESNSPTNVPTIEAVNKGLSARQLLVNNDFQIWQRGNSISTSGNKTEYFADMWCSAYASTFSEVGNGMKTSALAHIIQLLPKLETDKKYTFVLSINNIVYKEIFVGGTFKETDKFYYSASRETTEKGNLSLIAIKLNANDILNYADLFEGDIVYPHIKENYDIAYLKCRTKIKLIESQAFPVFEYTNGEVMFKAMYNEIFKGNPTINIKGGGYINTDGNYTSLKPSDFTIVNRYSSLFEFIILPVKNLKLRSITVLYIASNEPL